MTTTKYLGIGGALLALAGAATITLAVYATADPISTDPAPAPVSHSAQHFTRAPGRTGIPAPTTVAGYRAMFATVPVDQWGAADVSQSVLANDGRTVWLYGDTTSTGRFVHSTAIVQTGGVLHVSHGGAQLLPDEATSGTPTPADPSLIYWIMYGQAGVGDQIIVTARQVAIFGTGPWDFRDNGVTATAVTTLDAAGDLTFDGWQSKVPAPAPVTGPMWQVGPHHFEYGRVVHSAIRLASGRVLVTTCQNWDDPLSDHVNPDGSFRYQDFRPLFSHS